MDALADLASMQNHQPARTAAPILRRNTESFESQGSPSTMYPSMQTNHLTPRASIDFAMADTPKQPTRTDFSKTSLSAEQQERAATLATHLQDNPHAHETHVELIKILHDGFLAHVYPPDQPAEKGDPQEYDLLAELRSTRENMDKLFALGEDLWVDWIRDESILASTLEERVGVMEKCQKAIEEEYGSTKLWTTYGDWILYSYNLVQGLTAPNDSSDLSEEDKIVGKEIFSWQLVIDTWSRGAQETMWRINDSHLVWNRYIEIVMQDLARAPSPEGISSLNSLFETRVKIPHTDWDSTNQLYSSFLSTYMNDKWESIWVSMTRIVADAKAQLAEREQFEFDLSKAQESGDTATEYALWASYIEWDATPGSKKHTSFDLTNALYERAELRFSSDSNIWEDHMHFILHAKKSTFPLLARATRHCPWAGSLWSQYILASEREGLAYAETEEIKHKATNTGLLEVGGFEEVLKVHTAWCNYLRRRAFQVGSLDEDLDVAEMGIRSSIETLQELGAKKYGKDFHGDPHFRLERVYIKFLSESGSWDSARETFRGLINSRGGSWEFWMRWYIWEMMCWAKFIQGENAPLDESRTTAAPHYATSVLKQGMEREDVDWPERLIQAYVVHCEDHEDAETLQHALAQARSTEKKVSRRRQQEAEEASKSQATHSDPAAVSADQAERRVSSASDNANPGKRKRDDEAQPEEESNKKSRADEDVELTNAPASTAASERAPKRDRENSTVLVENLPGDIKEVRVRQFFRDCGVINSLKVFHSSAEESTAIIEFEEQSAALAAQTRDHRDLDGHTISVQIGSGSTIFVSNFPPTADESYIRDLFDPCGEIVDIRFPSLKYNTHRRFCYVQFKLNAQAQAATELNDRVVGDDLKLVAKISNPLNKQDRSGPMEEGREVYVRNIDWSLSEEDLQAKFEEFGAIQSVRIPRGVNGKSKGFGYIVFSTKEEASAALQMDQKMIKNRAVHVEISSKTGAKRQASSIITRVDHGQSPADDRNGASPRSSAGPTGVQPTGDRQDRTIGLLNVPDTVNDRRIRAIAEPYGTLVKVILRPDHQGAIVEYLHASDAGKASLGLEGFEISPGRGIHVGTVPEMLKQAADVKVDKIQVGKQKRVGVSATASTFHPSGPIARPAPPGRRGGLGMKRRGGLLGGASSGPSGAAEGSEDAHGSSNGTVSGKSNDDFRALLEKR